MYGVESSYPLGGRLSWNVLSRWKHGSPGNLHHRRQYPLEESSTLLAPYNNRPQQACVPKDRRRSALWRRGNNSHCSLIFFLHGRYSIPCESCMDSYLCWTSRRDKYDMCSPSPSTPWLTDLCQKIFVFMGIKPHFVVVGSKIPKIFEHSFHIISPLLWTLDLLQSRCSRSHKPPIVQVYHLGLYCL